MSAVTPMEAYATTDGKLFTDPLEAQAHQHGIDIKKDVWDFVGYDPKQLGFFTNSEYLKISAIIDWEVAKKMKELKGERT